MELKQLPQKILRRLIIGWLVAATVEFLLTLPLLSQVEGLAKMSLLRLGLITLVVSGLFWLIRWGDTEERIVLVAALAALVFASLLRSFTKPFLWVCLGILAAGGFYLRKGWNGQSLPTRRKAIPGKKGRRSIPESPWEAEHPVFVAVTAGLALAFFWFVSAWGVGRVDSFSTPSYDFGIFSQMFHSMRTRGLPITTLERSKELSHFAVHVSPTYYLMLPFYALFPKPATLQVLQAAVLASSVIPLWLIGKHHGLGAPYRTLLCGLLLLYPALSGGAAGYDLHENCFLTPCLLWLLYAMDTKKLWLVGLSAVLTLGVKEDAAVYVAVAALYLMLRSLLHRDRFGLITGGVLLAVSLGWFFAVTHYLSTKGDGVMTYRYDNFMFDGSGSLITVVKAVILCPMKAVYECVDEEKLKFLYQTILPLALLPLFTRRYERYLLLIPYVLVNLMSDYQYQHDIYFQYTFGSTACLFYLTAVNLADIQIDWKRLSALGAALILCAGFFGNAIVSTGLTYIRYAKDYVAFYDSIRHTLDAVPDGASVTSTTFYTTYLSQRDILYDIGYCSQEQMFSTDYIVLNLKDNAVVSRYGSTQNLTHLLETRGYTVCAQLDGVLAIYQKPAP